tara:strand:+ start:127 stop:354 length:228 start_codon:yes stop_codon:yes gene_type:complete
MWEELLREIILIKWGVVCIAASLWGVTVYLLLKEIPEWWRSYNERKKKFTLEQMKKDLANAERPRTEFNKKSQWD